MKNEQGQAGIPALKAEAEKAMRRYTELIKALGMVKHREAGGPEDRGLRRYYELGAEYALADARKALIEIGFREAAMAKELGTRG